MTEDFKIFREQVHIQDVATHLLGEPLRGMYKYPGERTASLKIYPQTQSFYDFGRNTGGDVIALWAHVRNCNNWEAMDEISALYGISTALNKTEKENIVAKIKRQEKAQKEREQAEKRKRKQWVMQVDRLKAQEELCNNLLDSPHIQPFSDVWCWLINLKQIVSYRLDCMCGILD